MIPISLLIGYCAAIVAASMFGGYLPSLLRLTHVRMQLIMSLVGGLMLGVAVLHMLPHAAADLPTADHLAAWVLAGILVTFALLRLFHFHEHTALDEDDEAHDHACDHAHHHQAHRLSWLGVALGLSLHTLIDGVALGASVMADAQHDTGIPWLGLGTFLAILLHKPLDALSITTLMTAGGWRADIRQAVNVVFASMCPLGAALFVLGLTRFEVHGPVVIGSALAFSAGVFLCISLGDLLPELQFHSHHRIRLSVALLAGIAVAYGIGQLETGHSHAHDQPESHRTGEPALP